MKELSIEEKAKRYDEALEIAKEVNNEHRAQPFDIMLKIFPELKESEDERIRKELLNAFQKSEDSLYMVLTPHRRESFITWLERQGQTFTKKDIDDAYLKGVCDAKKELEKQREQNPNPCDVCDHPILNCQNFPCELKKGEWSKENKDNLLKVKCVIDEVWGNYECSNYSKGELEELWHWLDNLWQRVLYPTNLPEKEMKELLRTEYEKGRADAIAEIKHEWSEEDEKAINNIMWIIEAYRKNGFNETHIQMADSSENWLKSLEPQLRWKPSKEQMEVLARLNITGCLTEQHDCDVLVSLYEQLQKL